MNNTGEMLAILRRLHDAQYEHMMYGGKVVFEIKVWPWGIIVSLSWLDSADGYDSSSWNIYDFRTPAEGVKTVDEILEFLKRKERELS